MPVTGAVIAHGPSHAGQGTTIPSVHEAILPLCVPSPESIPLTVAFPDCCVNVSLNVPVCDHTKSQLSVIPLPLLVAETVPVPENGPAYVVVVGPELDVSAFDPPTALATTIPPAAAAPPITARVVAERPPDAPAPLTTPAVTAAPAPAAALPPLD